MKSFIVPYFFFLLGHDFTECLKVTQKNLDLAVGPVVFVNMLFRHGDRNPLKPCPTDPYRDLKYWPEGYGQLTKAGKLHHYQLGRWLRKRYLHLIPNGQYRHDVVKVQSTDMDRTLMSAQVNLAGMFPPQKEEKWSQMNWQPIPIHTVPKYMDNVLSMGAPCRKYDRLYRSFKKSEEYKKIREKYKPALDYCTRYAGKSCSLGSIYDINSDLLIEQLRNFSLPNWTDKIYPQLTEEVAALQLAMSTWTLEMKRLLGGPLVKKMTDNMLRKIKGANERQSMAIFSAHDSTVARLLNTLGVYDFVSPPFYSLVLVELRHGHDNEHYVTVQYKNTTNTSGKPYLIKLPGCDEACPLSKMIDLLNPIIPTDWNRECADEGHPEELTVRTNEIDQFLEDNDEIFDEDGRPLRLGFRFT